MSDHHVVPPTEHVLTTMCWCQPGVEEVPGTDERIVIHRRYIDGRLYEDAAAEEWAKLNPKTSTDEA